LSRKFIEILIPLEKATLCFSLEYDGHSQAFLERKHYMKQILCGACATKRQHRYTTSPKLKENSRIANKGQGQSNNKSVSLNSLKNNLKINKKIVSSKDSTY